MPPHLPDTSMLAQLFASIANMMDGKASLYVLGARTLMGLLIPIEVVFLGIWMALDGGSAIRRALTAVVRFGLFYWLVEGWPKLMTTVIHGFEQAGSRLSGGPADTDALIDLTRRILDTGANACQQLLIVINQLSLDGARNSGEINLLVLCYALAMGGFFLAAAQILLVSVEFLVVSVLGIVLLPFGVFARTAFLAENILRAVVVLGVRKMTMIFIVLALNEQYSYYAYPAETGANQTQAGAIALAFNLMFWALAIGLLVWRIPLHLSALVGKAPSLYPAQTDNVAVHPPMVSESHLIATAEANANAGIEATRAAAGALPSGPSAREAPAEARPGQAERARQRMAPKLKK
jgi:type IV secretion system protein TrbL